MTVADLARQLKRDYKNVHNDCESLIEWMAIEKDENGLVFAPYDEIIVDMKLPETQVLIDEFRSRLKWPLLYWLERKFKVSYESKHIDLAWKAEEGRRLAVTLPASSEVLEFLNGDEESKNAAKKALKDIYHYTGEFYFSKDEIPF